jgi:hypothetical protein
MKAIHNAAILKVAIAAALIGALAVAIRRKTRSLDNIPVLQPVRDSEPNIEEPLQDDDLRVAQNAPL